MPSPTYTGLSVLAALLALSLAPLGAPPAAADAPARQQLAQVDDAYRPGSSVRRDEAYRPDDAYRGGQDYSREPYPPDDAYRPDADAGGASPDADGAYRPRGGSGSGPAARPAPPPPRGGDYGEPYASPRQGYGPADEPPGRYADEAPGSYSQNEILGAGHRFFGSVSQGLAGVVEYAFGKAGRPNGYILGEDAGGALIAGLRYGEGILHTKDAGHHKVYWQGPSVGYDFGAEGSKTMVLVYNLRDPAQIYNRFAGVEGSAYLVGGVSIQFQQYGDVILAPIRSGVGLRLGANLGYLKYTRSPTWNPF